MNTIDIFRSKCNLSTSTIKILLNKKGVAMQEKQDMISAVGNKVKNSEKDHNKSGISKKISRVADEAMAKAPSSWQYKIKNLFDFYVLIKRHNLILSKEIMLDALFNSEVINSFRNLYNL